VNRRVVFAIPVAVVVVAAGVGAAFALTSGSDSAPRRARAVTPASPKPSTTSSSTTTTTAVLATTTTRAAPVAPAPGGTGAVAGKTITIDAGHNGKNYAHTAEINRMIDIGTQQRACDTTGTSTNDGYTEAAYTLDVALRLQAVLERAGAHVVMTRSDNNGWGPCINERAAIGNRAHAAVAISIHADGGPADGRGFHVIYPPSLPGLTDDIAVASKRLALDVRTGYAAGTHVPYATYLGNAGLSERSDLGGLNLSDVPKVFIETGNMRNTTDAALLKDAAFRQQAAQAIGDGLAAYLAGR
jgi:N-acetylmuramoyl-L-alanine amidase